MKQLFLFTLLSLSLFAIELPWLHDVEAAKKIAQKEHKDIYVFVGADKCRFCDMYKKEALSKPKVIAALQKKFVLVYLSRDRHSIPKEFQKFGVPLHYFLTPKGEIYFLDAGVKNADGVFLMIDEAELHKEE